jgi:Family of unknown function (DUF6428)
MKLSAFTALLRQHPDSELTFVLPDGGYIPAHFHITEAGRADKSFIDCGSTLRRTATCSLQAWVADDLDHRLSPAKLAKVLEIAAPLFNGDDLDVEIEYQDGFISQFPVVAGASRGDALLFELGTKHTDCLAKDVCLPEPVGAGCCTPGGGCC